MAVCESAKTAKHYDRTNDQITLDEIERIAFQPVSAGARPMSRDTRQKRDVHALDENGMVVCNPRDKEAAHRAEMEGIATEDRAAVTCRKCLSKIFKSTRT
jgi:hypothetical protein